MSLTAAAAAIAVSQATYNVGTLAADAEQTFEFAIKAVDARDLPSGMYFYRMHAGDFTDARSTILVK